MATANYSWTLPTVGGSDGTWGTENNTLWTDLDTLLGGITNAEFARLDVATAGTSEANKVVTADANGDVNLAEELKAKSYNETFASVSSSAGTATINAEAGNVFAISTTENTTFVFSNPPTTGTAYGMALFVTAGGTHTLTWPASVDWPGGVAPTAPASGETDAYVFVTRDGGTNWFGFLAGEALA